MGLFSWVEEKAKDFGSNVKETFTTAGQTTKDVFGELAEGDFKNAAGDFRKGTLKNPAFQGFDKVVSGIPIIGDLWRPEALLGFATGDFKGGGQAYWDNVSRIFGGMDGLNALESGDLGGFIGAAGRGNLSRFGSTGSKLGDVLKNNLLDDDQRQQFTAARMLAAAGIGGGASGGKAGLAAWPLIFGDGSGPPPQGGDGGLGASPHLGGMPISDASTNLPQQDLIDPDSVFGSGGTFGSGNSGLLG